MGGGLTGDGEHVGLDLGLDLEAASPLGVVRPTQAGHVGHAAFVDVHHTVWGGGEERTLRRDYTCRQEQQHCGGVVRSFNLADTRRFLDTIMDLLL